VTPSFPYNVLLDILIPPCKSRSLSNFKVKLSMTSKYLDVEPVTKTAGVVAFRLSVASQQPTVWRITHLVQAVFWRCVYHGRALRHTARRQSQRLQYKWNINRHTNNGQIHRHLGHIAENMLFVSLTSKTALIQKKLWLWPRHPVMNVLCAIKLKLGWLFACFDCHN